MELRVMSSPEEDLTWVALDGRLDLQGTGEIDLQFTSITVAQRKPAVIDLAGVLFLASIGMRLLVTTAKSLGRFGHRCVLVNPRENVRAALDTAGLGHVLLIASNESEAFQLARGAAH